MGFMDAVKACLTNYAGFTGRARRSEYWFFLLAILAADVAVMILSSIASILGILGLALLGAIVPAIAVGARRLHDIGKSGWLQLLYLIPLVGIILWIVWGVQDSQPGNNQYGPNPKGAAAVPPAPMPTA